MEAIIQELVPYGPGAVFAAVVFFAYKKQSEDLLQVIRNNTTAITMMCERLSSIESTLERLKDSR